MGMYSRFCTATATLSEWNLVSLDTSILPILLKAKILNNTPPLPPPPKDRTGVLRSVRRGDIWSIRPLHQENALDHSGRRLILASAVMHAATGWCSFSLLLFSALILPFLQLFSYTIFRSVYIFYHLFLFLLFLFCFKHFALCSSEVNSHFAQKI